MNHKGHEVSRRGFGLASFVCLRVLRGNGVKWSHDLTLRTFDPDNGQPLGFKCAIPSQPRLCRNWQGPSFTLIRRDNYTTHSPFFVSQCVRRAKFWRAEPEASRKLEPAIAQTVETEIKSNRSKRGETWQP